jgi:signal transduction histidine kinase
MVDTTQRMQTLIDDLLSYIKIKGDARKIEGTDVFQIAQKAVNELQEVIGEKKAVVTVDGHCEAAVIPSQFLQLFRNLISNSLKFSHPDRLPHISVKIENVLRAPIGAPDAPALTNFCHVTVADNGIGFDQQYEEKIFQIFQRLNEYDKYKGTGIGLAICKKIVENHKGMIIAVGEVDKGATFDICVPCDKVHSTT